jgi:putative membrane protein
MENTSIKSDYVLRPKLHTYNPQHWFTFLFRFNRADTIRKLLPMILLISVYSGMVAYLEMEVWKLGEESHLRNISVMHSLLGFVISFLLVFRTNTAYERWWDGRRLWSQQVQHSRNLAIKLAAILPTDAAERGYFRILIPAYAAALLRHLNKKSPEQTNNIENLPADIQAQLDTEKHIPNQFIGLMHHYLQTMFREQKLQWGQVIFVNAELQAFTEICANCERIRYTPIPFSYSTFLKKFIFIYIMTLPFGYVFSLGYYVVPIVAFVFYVLASLELIAEEIEDPFGGDDNDLPLLRIVQGIKNQVEEAM